MSPLVQETINLLIAGRDVNPALQEIITVIIAGQHEGFTEAGILKINPPGVLVLELLDGSRWAVGAFRVSP